MSPSTRERIPQLLSRGHDLTHGFQWRLALRFGVSEATISRDIKAILQREGKCTICGAKVMRRRVKPACRTQADEEQSQRAIEAASESQPDPEPDFDD